MYSHEAVRDQTKGEFMESLAYFKDDIGWYSVWVAPDSREEHCQSYSPTEEAAREKASKFFDRITGEE